MRIIAHNFGDPTEVLVCEPTSRPQPEANSVIVQILASPINPSDLVTLAGAYRHRTPLPFVPGFEAVGVVDSVGRAVTTLRKGQRVLPLGSAGGWQTFKALPAEWCLQVPGDLTDDQAAMAYINPLTARLMFRSLAPTPGTLIGINAANSATGRILLRMAHAAGVRSVAIVRSAQAKSSLDVEPVFTVLLPGDPLPLLDGGFDAIGGASGAEMASAVKQGGVLIHYGLLSGVPLPSDLGSRVGATLRPFWLRQWVHSASRADLKTQMAAVFADIRAGVAATAVEARYTPTDVQAALAHNGLRDRQGKIILSMAAA